MPETTITLRDMGSFHVGGRRHRVRGEPMLPAVAYLEMALAAATHAGGGQADVRNTNIGHADAPLRTSWGIHARFIFASHRGEMLCADVIRGHRFTIPPLVGQRGATAQTTRPEKACAFALHLPHQTT